MKEEIFDNNYKGHFATDVEKGTISGDHDSIVSSKNSSSEKGESHDNFVTETSDDFSDTSSFYEKWFNQMNVESSGIEPIGDDKKTDPSLLNPTIVWFSANFVLSAYAIGALGPMVYGLNFGTCALTVIFFNIIGCIPVGYFSIFGAKLGIRQMILSRYWMGNITGRFFSLINVIACVGWCVLNTICSAQLLNMVNSGSSHQLPLWAGCLVIICGTVIISFFGYTAIHQFEKWSWIPNLAIFLVIIARLKMSGKWNDGEWTKGPTTAGNVLSFGCAVFGYSGAWATYASDYTVFMPRSTSSWKICIALSLGIYIPLCFVMILGAACGMGGVNDPTWGKLYDENSIGGLTYAVLVPDSVHGFGQFCCVVLALSTIANNLPNMYTVSLSVQALWSPLAKIPRPCWTLAGNAAALTISILACYFFKSFLENFMNTIAYYGAIYIALGLCEHLLFRKNYQSYNIQDWQDYKKMPIGIAGTTAFIVAAFGVALGMCQTYWVGEIAKRIGKDGGDIGFELGAAWGAVVYVIVRPLELKYFGR
ncbi:similar to Saccharomyces cerevisiae YER056C FCY2 Purine-cytosine permease, mediates purine (adenine, guanine, and hypoxanthine) and cytosine accumulation [Maudiozyma saulgeensis]|uniref:Similar to Saccharomyces cerevisiae YER056C FCY2 Purine-cytosine permease, mediates purine (Adenine, guanine, and hypoxanthine) and cytosine accumulation n=1 Tax=Maudiozyma saulgeensis TaxID=1789683 RepID=A0A1X7R331_9SACH|nr:similar to Saccharomyces cerevisiae YER056C FCY2 Purine-cytosine permease, mediates purine (adenine, guanine, and hypoxanthine) and cytosine accumulation [Kazachstania saulgeensis]